MAVKDILECLFWTILAAAVVFYGTGDKDLITVVLTDQRLNRLFINIALASCGLNVAIFAYTYIWLQAIKRVSDPLQTAPWIQIAGAGTMTVAVFAFIIGLWPLFGILALFQVIIVGFGFVMGVNFIPGFGILKPSLKQD